MVKSIGHCKFRTTETTGIVLAELDRLKDLLRSSERVDALKSI